MEERENKKLGTILNYAIIVCIAAILIMIICGIVGKFLDKKTNRIGEFSERHPRLNMVIALALVVIMGTAGYVSIYYIVCKVKEIIHWIADMASKMDAVVIVINQRGVVYEEAREDNETDFSVDVGMIISQLEIYDQIWFVRHMPKKGEHSREAKKLVAEIVSRLENIPDGGAESFPFELIDELKEEYLSD